MPRRDRHRLTKAKLLWYTGKQADRLDIQEKLRRHELAKARLKRSGWEYDENTGRLKPKGQP